LQQALGTTFQRRAAFKRMTSQDIRTVPWPSPLMIVGSIGLPDDCCSRVVLLPLVAKIAAENTWPNNQKVLRARCPDVCHPL
jgi:hypothetical protein